MRLIINTFKKELNKQLRIMKLQKRMLKVLKVRKTLLDEAIIQSQAKDVEPTKILLKIEDEIHKYSDLLDSEYELMKQQYNRKLSK